MINSLDALFDIHWQLKALPYKKDHVLSELARKGYHHAGLFEHSAAYNLKIAMVNADTDLDVVIFVENYTDLYMVFRSAEDLVLARLLIDC